MKDLLKNIITETFAEARADKLLKNALKKENLSGEFYLLAVGKAAKAMADAAMEEFSDRIQDHLIITSERYLDNHDKNSCLLSDHPYPGNLAVAAGKKVYDYISRFKRGDQMLMLISGGASAMLELPAEGVTIDDINSITQKLQKCGADIIELNTVRKHLSQLKGGRLSTLAEPANIYSFILSDVPGDRFDTIGSGLTAADKTTSDSALEILAKYKIEIDDVVRNAIREETPKNLRNTINRIIGNNELLCNLAAESAMKNGYIPWLVTTSMEGEAGFYAKMIPDMVRNARNPQSRINTPCIAICGGETTVTVKGSGKGGRNLEMALNAAIEIKDMHEVYVAAVASDGIDGNTEYAGAVVDQNSYNKMLSTGMKPEDYLKNNDSGSALEKIDAVIEHRYTQTNLNDLLLVLIK